MHMKLEEAISKRTYRARELETPSGKIGAKRAYDILFRVMNSTVTRQAIHNILDEYIEPGMTPPPKTLVQVTIEHAFEELGERFHEELYKELQT